MMKIQERNGKLYLVKKTPAWCEPIMRTFWWPTGICSHGWDDIIGHEVRAYSVEGGLYEICDCNTWSAPQIRLENNGKTKAEFVDEDPIAPPKRAKQVRWLHGRWEKLLSRGWVTA